ncbi:MAG: dTMP kinase [Candidatus Hydrogenedentota bacterium]
MSGLFITFEGGEGVGKSTQIERLKNALKTAGHEVVVTREPGGTPIAERIRDVLLDPANDDMTPMAELMLYEAARAQHVGELIQPALDAGRIVLCDRFNDSTTAYQGAGRDLALEDVEVLHQQATGGLLPDVTILLDLDPAVGLSRAKGEGAGDRIEKESLAFHERVRAGFLELTERFPKRIHRIDADQSIDAIADAVHAIVMSRLAARGD